MKRKVMALSLALCMLLSVAAGCEKAPSYDDIYNEVEEDIKKEYKKELSKELEDELRDKISEEIEEELREQLDEEYAEDLEAQLEEATEDLRDEIEEELRPEIEAELRETLESEISEELEADIREELEAEYDTKLQEAIDEYIAANPADDADKTGDNGDGDKDSKDDKDDKDNKDDKGGEGDDTTAGGNPPTGETGFVEAEVDFDVTNFEFDKKHMVVNGTGLTFGVTKCKNIPDEFYGYISKDERATYYVNEKRVTWITCQMANDTGKSDYSTYDSCYIQFVNLDYEGPLLLNECSLYEVQLSSKAMKGRILSDDGLSFDIGSGLTENSTYEDFVAVLGEPSSDFTYEYDDGSSTTKYSFGSTMMQGWSLNVTFLNGVGICEIDYTGYVYND